MYKIGVELIAISYKSKLKLVISIKLFLFFFPSLLATPTQNILEKVHLVIKIVTCIELMSHDLSLSRMHYQNAKVLF